jgi:arylsulfatase A-like enzyme
MLAWGAREMFLDRGELLRTAGHVVLLCAGAGALAGALAAVLVAAGHRLSRPGGPLHGTGRREVALAALLCAPLAVVGWLLTAGPKASALPWRPLIVLATAALLGLAASWSALRLARWSVGSVGRRLALAAGAVVLAAVAVAIDRSTFVRLYPAFHASLAAGAWLVATAGLAPLGPIPRHRLARAALAVLVAAAVVGGGLSLASLRGMQNARFVVSERTGAAARLLDLARAARPPADPWLEETAAAAPSPVSSGPAPLLAVVRPRASVHLISIDAMRADRLLPPDGARAPAPNLDALAREGVVFTRAYTPIPHTSYALASLLTGKYLYPLFEVPGAPPVHETLPGILGRFRYRSAGFFTRAIFFIDRARFEPYLRSGFGFGHADIEYSVPAPELADRLVTHLVETRDDPRPILTWLHLFEPHEPYDPACTRFGASPEERYDCEIAVADEAAGRLLDHLRESDPGAIVIAFADHGEEFGDHGGRYHGSTLYDEQVRVPLVIRVPGLPHRVVDEPVNLVDLPATILALLDIPVPARMRSRDLTGLLAGHPPEGPGETFSELPEEVMTVREGHKLICGRHSGICRLHDLAEDPGETRNLAESRAELTRSLRARIAAFEAGHAERELRPVVTDAERAGWPAPIRAALTGGAVDREALIGLIEQGAAPEFRRKAAEILAREAATDPARLPAGDPAADPEVEAWLALASGAGADRLGELAPDLEPGSAVRRAVTLARLEQGDRRATADALALVADSGVPLAERLRGLDLLGRYGSRAAAEGLTGMLDDYRVSTAVAGALARLGHRPAVPRLIARMARERFPERREALAAALGALRDRRAIEPLARELLREEPAPLALRALVDVGAATSRGTRIRAGDPAREVVVFAPAAGVFEGPDRILRLALLTRAAADGGELVARCDGAEVARVPLVAGDQAVVVDIEDCGGGAHPPRIELALEPVDAEASIPAAALIGAP